MQDELKVKAAHFWTYSRTLIDRFESEVDLNIVLFHSIAPFCGLAVPRKNGLFVLKDIPRPDSAKGSQVYRTRVWEIVNAARYGQDESDKIFNLLELHLDAVIDAIGQHLSPYASEENLVIIELVFEKILIAQKKIHPYHSTIVSHLVKALLPGFEYADEFFPHTGDFQVSVQRELGYTLGTAMSFHAAPNEGMLRLRLLAHNIELAVERKFPSDDYSSSKRLLLVDQGGQSSRDLKRQGVPTISEVVDQMICPPPWFYPKSVIILQGTQLSIKVLERLITSGQILAVVDFETLNPAGKVRISTAIVLSDRRKSIDSEVLFVDMTKLTRWSGDAVLTSAAELAGNILALTFGRGRSNRVSGEHRYASLLNSWFQSNFSEGYRDVIGVCELQSRSVLQIKTKTLRASNYLATVNEKQVPVWLDAAPILAALPPQVGSHSCIYVIGNNGVGKSFLLRNLAIAISKLSVSTFGIAFGITDRFGFAVSQCPDGFQYLGTGSLRGSNALKSYCVSLANMMHRLFCSVFRRAAFQAASTSIGFAGRYYIMPWKMSSADIESDKGLSDIRLLDELASDFELLSDYKLGVVRNENGGITPFDELSSGEQQLLSLIIKITANATPGAVVLVDEPEISLHVSWQQALPVLLNSMSRNLECSFVVATHSPVITANASHVNDQCFAVSIGKLEQVTATQRRSVESVLFEGFNTYTPNNRQIHERCAAIVGSVIRSVNQSGLVEDSVFNRFDEELEQMHLTVVGKGKNDASPQYQDDLTLIFKARMAIKELQASVGAQSR